MTRSWTTFIKKNSWNSLQNKPTILSDDQISFSEIINKPTTLSGYGITDAQPLGNELTALQALVDTTGFLRKTGNGSYEIDTKSYLPSTGGTVSGDLNIGGAFFANKLIGAWNQGIYLGSSDTLNYSPSAIEIPTNTAYGGVYGNHTGARICCGEMFAWGTAQIQFYISNSWGTYHSTPCFTAQNGSIRIPQSATISISTPGKIGTICWDSNYIYVCTATNTWKRALLSSW